jgi:hypothetical protein
MIFREFASSAQSDKRDWIVGSIAGSESLLFDARLLSGRKHTTYDDRDSGALRNFGKQMGPLSRVAGLMVTICADAQLVEASLLQARNFLLHDSALSNPTGSRHQAGSQAESLGTLEKYQDLVVIEEGFPPGET